MSTPTVRMPAEEILLEHGTFVRRSAPRRMLLGCLGCRWATSRERDPGTPASTYGYEILECGKLESGVMYPILDSLESGGVIVRVREEVNAVYEERPPRRYILPAETELGQAVEAALSRPTICGID